MSTRRLRAGRHGPFRQKKHSSIPSVRLSDVPSFTTFVDAASLTEHADDKHQWPLPSPPQPPPPPQVPHNSSTWPQTALLWWCMWSSNWTFLHIPKAGGTAIEMVDRQAPKHRLPDLFRLRYPGNGSLQLTLQHGCSWWPPRRGAFPNVVHLTPEQWEHCLGDKWSPYQHPSTGSIQSVHPLISGGTYCVMRDPVERFVSAFLDGRFFWYWPRAQCPLKSMWDKRKGRLAAELWCLARLTRRLMISFNAQWSRRHGHLRDPHWYAPGRRARTGGRDSAADATPSHSVNFSEFFTHMMPQQWFVGSSDGRLGRSRAARRLGTAAAAAVANARRPAGNALARARAARSRAQ